MVEVGWTDFICQNPINVCQNGSARLVGRSLGLGRQKFLIAITVKVGPSQYLNVNRSAIQYWIKKNLQQKLFIFLNKESTWLSLIETSRGDKNFKVYYKALLIITRLLAQDSTESQRNAKVKQIIKRSYKVRVPKRFRKIKGLYYNHYLIFIFECPEICIACLSFESIIIYADQKMSYNLQSISTKVIQNNNKNPDFDHRWLHFFNWQWKQH